MGEEAMSEGYDAEVLLPREGQLITPINYNVYEHSTGFYYIYSL